MKTSPAHTAPFTETLLSVLSLAILVLLAACAGVAPDNREDRILARVHNKTLYLSELEGMIPEGTPLEDSVRIVESYVNRWAREALLLYEAERNLPNDLNIDKLVRDYRSSLIKANYEKVLVEQLPDSTITREELKTFYDQNKEQYALQSPIIRCYFIKTPLPVQEEANLNRWWARPQEGDHYDQLVNWSNNFATAHSLEDSTWHQVDDIAVLMPPGMLTPENVATQREIIASDEAYQYYYRLMELKNRMELAPLSFIEDQARKTILHKRKIRLLEDKKEDLYAVGLRRNNINIYLE